MPKYKFRIIKEFKKEGDIEESSRGIMTESESETATAHVIALEDAAILPPELRQYLPTMLTLRQYFDMLLRQYLPTFTSLIKYGVLWICIELLHRL